MKSKHIKGIFLSRPNRFVVECKVEGRVIKAYLPNPGRLIELLFPDVVLYLEKNSDFELKYRYMVIGIQKAYSFINLHTHQTNDIIQELLAKKQIKPP